MPTASSLFESLRDHASLHWPEVAPGRMMSSPAITYQGKVFAFFSRRDHMVFKLGKHYQPEGGLAPFNPFKKKGPLSGWFQAPVELHHLWEPLARQALEQLKTEMV